MADVFELKPITELHLDTTNPRLPESIRGQGEEVVLRYLFEEAALEELAQSFIDNGVFPHEPLIVTKREKVKGLVVLEGNRRLATLLILAKHPTAGDTRFVGIDAPDAKLKGLQSVPTYRVGDEGEVHRFLGFRHIGGIKEWPAEAKARYVHREVLEAAHGGEENPFQYVARRVGTNSQTIRTLFHAIAILIHARDEFGLTEVPHIQAPGRFGVWQRCMSSPGIRDYIGFGSATSYAETQSALNRTRKSSLREVLRDLLPQGGAERPVLADSRQASDYGKVLQDVSALKILRDRGDLELAIKVIEFKEFHLKVRRVRETCEVLVSELASMDATEDARQEVAELARIVRSMQKLAGEK